MKYIIITPAKNEGEFIENTIKSVISQSILPQEWIIVDDGSTDDTVEKIKKYLPKYSWIKLVERKTKQEKRSGGGKVVRAFNEGYEHVKIVNYDFITKLDADLSFANNYFECISNAFKNNSKLGICGGVCYIERNKNLIKENANMYHVRGALKSIRIECYNEIGGFKTELFWDGIDEHTARYMNWEVYSIDVQVIHHRPTNSAYSPLIFDFKNGYAARQRRASFMLTVIRSILKARTSPYTLNSFAYIFGFLWALFKREKNILEKNISKAMNQFDYMKLFRKKQFRNKYLNKEL